MKRINKNLVYIWILLLTFILVFTLTVMFNLMPNRRTIIKRAEDMAFVKWSPPKNIPMWKSKDEFEKGTIYTGIPYTWSTNQARNSTEFLEMIKNNTDLEFHGYNRVGPNYGNDCSGFVSAVWNIPRCTTHTIDKYTKYISLNDLLPGDALLADEHIMLFASWADQAHTKVTVFEQTPPKVTISTYEISYLVSEKYKPIRLKFAF